MLTDLLVIIIKNKMGKVINIVGNIYGRYTVLNRAESKNTATMWNCRCECGTIKIVGGSCLKKGHTVSCGCFLIDKLTKHGETGSKFYIIWRAMMQRCNYAKDVAYKHYGGRGIKICERWLTYVYFKEDMYPTFSAGLTLDRKDVNGDYTFENCKWATRKEQGNNRRTNHMVNTPWGVMTMMEASIKGEIAYCTLKARIKSGWRDERLFIPLTKRRGVNKRKPTILK